MGRGCGCCGKKIPCTVVNFIPISYFETDKTGPVSISELLQISNKNFTFNILPTLFNPIKYDISYFSQLKYEQATGLYFDICSCAKSSYPSQLIINDGDTLLYKDDYNYIARSYGKFKNPTINKNCGLVLRSDYDRKSNRSNNFFIYHKGESAGKSLINLNNTHPYNSSIYIAPDKIANADTGNTNTYSEIYGINNFSLGAIQGNFNQDNLISANLDMCKYKGYSFATAYTSCVNWPTPCSMYGTGAFFTSDLSFKEPIKANISEIQKIKNVNTSSINYPILYKITPPNLPEELSMGKGTVNVSYSTELVAKGSFSVPNNPLFGCQQYIKVGDNAKNAAETAILSFNGTASVPDQYIYNIDGASAMYQTVIGFAINNSREKTYLPPPDYGIFKSILGKGAWQTIVGVPRLWSIGGASFGMNGIIRKKYYTFSGGIDGSGICFDPSGSKINCSFNSSSFCNDPAYNIDPTIGIEQQEMTQPLDWAFSGPLIPIPPNEPPPQLPLNSVGYSWQDGGMNFISEPDAAAGSYELSKQLNYEFMSTRNKCFDDKFGRTSFSFKFVTGPIAFDLNMLGWGFNVLFADKNQKPLQMFCDDYPPNGRDLPLLPWDAGWAYGITTVTFNTG